MPLGVLAHGGAARLRHALPLPRGARRDQGLGGAERRVGQRAGLLTLERGGVSPLQRRQVGAKPGGLRRRLGPVLLPSKGEDPALRQEGGEVGAQHRPARFTGQPERFGVGGRIGERDLQGGTQRLALLGVAIQAIEPDLLALEQVGARPPAFRHLRLEQLRLLRQLLPASRFRGGALRGCLVRPVLKGLDVRREGGSQ